MSEKNKMGPEPENRSLTQPNKKREIKKPSGALRAPDGFIFLCFAAFRHQMPQNFPARFARRMASIS